MKRKQLGNFLASLGGLAVIYSLLVELPSSYTLLLSVIGLVLAITGFVLLSSNKKTDQEM